jgi:cytidine deaminase
MSNLKGNIKETTVSELLPFAFSDKDLKKWNQVLLQF